MYNTLILNILTISDMRIISTFHKTMINGLHFMFRVWPI